MDQFEQTDQIPQRQLYQDAEYPEIVKYEVGAGDCRNITELH
jgi:hypothetical protein